MLYPDPYDHRPDTFGVLEEVYEERDRQDARFGEQNHPDGTDLRYASQADLSRRSCDIAHKAGKGTWAGILTEEYWEAMSEVDPDKLRAELVQVAAVAVNWIEAIDRRPV